MTRLERLASLIDDECTSGEMSAPQQHFAANDHTVRFWALCLEAKKVLSEQPRKRSPKDSG